MINFKKISYCFTAAILTIFLIFSMARADQERVIEKSFEAAPGGLLTIDSDRGSVMIIGGEDNRIGVEIYLKVKQSNSEKAEQIFDDFQIEFEQDKNDLTIYAEYMGKNKSWWGNNDRNRLKVEYYISIPKQFDIDIKTGGGSITVEEMNGNADISTSGGSLNLKKVIGDIRGRTSGGSINLKDCDGFVDVKTSGGSININRIKGEINARTSGGSINVEEILGSIDAATSGGSVSARITGQPKEDCRLTTSGGSVNVYLDKNVNLYVDAKTSAGYVDTDFPVTVKGKLKKSKLQGDINNGGPELYLRTSGGNININEI